MKSQLRFTYDFKHQPVGEAGHWYGGQFAKDEASADKCRQQEHQKDKHRGSDEMIGPRSSISESGKSRDEEEAQDESLLPLRLCG